MLKSKKRLVEDALELANQTIPTTKAHIYVAFEYGEKLAKYYHADQDIVAIGLYLMDVKLKEAGKLGKKSEHAHMASEFAKEFLKDYDITKEDFDKIINCIESHHGKIPYKYIESEICANADCYIFIHPRGVFTYLGLLAKRGMSLKEQLEQLKFKLEEKYGILSLYEAKEELEEYYQMFVTLFSQSLNDLRGEYKNEK